MADDRPKYYYLMQHREDGNGTAGPRSIIGRFPYGYPRRRVFEHWHDDIVVLMREEAEQYIDGAETVEGDIKDDSRAVLDFTMCAEPGCKYVLEIIPSGMSDDMEEAIDAGKMK